MSRTVIIAAMEREVRPLVRGWRQGPISNGGRSFQAFEKEDMAVVISGTGRKHAEAAARAAVARYRPEQLISAGVAGALIRSLKAGSVFMPNVVVDAADGTEYRASVERGGVVGGGILVSVDEIAGAEAKSALVERFHALVVDMEAAGVAKVASEAGTGFGCAKAISDEADFVMPPLGQFIDAEGHFHSGRFAAWTMLRPWHWAKVVTLGRNTSRAVRALCEWLVKNLAAAAPPSGVVTLKRADIQDVVSERL
jgi:nucleoside phosphorylase